MINLLFVRFFLCQRFRLINKGARINRRELKIQFFCCRFTSWLIIHHRIFSYRYRHRFSLLFLSLSIFLLPSFLLSFYQWSYMIRLSEYLLLHQSLINHQDEEADRRRNRREKTSIEKNRFFIFFSSPPSLLLFYHTCYMHTTYSLFSRPHHLV